MSGEPIFRSTTAPAGAPVQDLAVVGLDGHPQLVCTHTDFENRMWTWDVLGDEWTERPLEPLRAYDDEEDPEAEEEGDDEIYPDFMFVGAEIVGGRVVVATGGHHQGPALWDLMSGELLSGALLSHGGVHALDTTMLDGHLALVAGNLRPEHYTWDAASPQWIDERCRTLPGHSDDMSDLAVAQVGGRPLVASVSGSEVLLTDLRSAGQLHTMAGTGHFTAVALSDTVVAATDDAGSLWRWDPADARPLGDPVEAHEKGFLYMDAVVSGERTLAVTGGDGGAGRLWDLTAGIPIAAPLTGHQGRITAVLATLMEDRPVAVTADQSGVIRVWDFMA
ncbi:WD40 repeat domain-containing protein [Nonomuraea fuscirosea]|uniref:WD40 repeat domain-containing protein n=1 Tax=Nonomuraea fuscirosea TaxID=1291556 RepID=UPI003444CAFD